MVRQVSNLEKLKLCHLEASDKEKNGRYLSPTFLNRKNMFFKSFCEVDWPQDSQSGLPILILNSGIKQLAILKFSIFGQLPLQAYVTHEGCQSSRTNKLQV